jgi:hypothetical protein
MTEVKLGEHHRAYIREDVIEVDLYYIRHDDGRQKFVEVMLMDVRAADSIRITYDFERDGWSVLQASTFSWPSDDRECDADWQEVAFIQAWAREKPGRDD